MSALTMRLPHLNDRCAHIGDQLIAMNGGRFNLDQYLRVLRARALQDSTVLLISTIPNKET
jgi:hypothetical protein